MNATHITRRRGINVRRHIEHSDGAGLIHKEKDKKALNALNQQISLEQKQIVHYDAEVWYWPMRLLGVLVFLLVVAILAVL